jgi:hypothetical protein
MQSTNLHGMMRDMTVLYVGFSEPLAREEELKKIMCCYAMS